MTTECPRCNGTGMIEADYEMSDPGSGRQRQRAMLYKIFGFQCPECLGTGKVEENNYDSERITLNIKVSNLKPEQAKRLSEFMWVLEALGNWGSSRMAVIWVDGDGDDRWKITVDGVRPDPPEDANKYLRHLWEVARS